MRIRRRPPDPERAHEPIASLTVRARMTAVLVVLSGTALASMVVIFLTTNSLLADMARRNEAELNRALAYAELAQVYADQETGVRGYILTSDGAYLAPYQQGRTREAELIAQLTTAAAD